LGAKIMATKRKFSFKRLLCAIGWLVVFKMVAFVMLVVTGMAIGTHFVHSYGRISMFGAFVAFAICRRAGVLPGLRTPEDAADVAAVFADVPAKPLAKPASDVFGQAVASVEQGGRVMPRLSSADPAKPQTAEQCAAERIRRLRQAAA